MRTARPERRLDLRWWWARLTRTTIAPPQAFKKSALILEAAHINRQLLRRLDDPPVTRAERRWWREHFGPPDGYLDQGAPSHMHRNLIDRQWRDRWESRGLRAGRTGSLGGSQRECLTVRTGQRGAAG
jgi:hypothetical protein